MRILIPLLLLPFALAKPLPLSNPSFESGLDGWSADGDNGMTKISGEAAASGSKGIRVTDTSDKAGSSLTSQKFPAKAGNTYAVRFRARVVSGEGLGVYLFFLDASGKLLNSGKHLRDVGREGAWKAFDFEAVAVEGTASVAVNIHSYGKAIITADFDDFSIEETEAPRAAAAVSPDKAFAPAIPGIKGRVFALPNGDFEKGLEAWSNDGDNGMCRVIPEAARGGKSGLRILDESDKAGSSLASPLFPAVPGKEYRVRCFSRMSGGTGGIGLYLQFFDANGQPIQGSTPDLTGLPGVKDWKQVDYGVYAPDQAASWRIWFHSFNSAKVTQDVDDVVLYESDVAASERPWPPQYKIKPHEKQKLTAADLIGPDGLVYPDFRRAGVPGGIPQVPVKVDLTGKIKPGTDISGILEREAEALGKKGGGAIFIPAGTYELAHDVLITNHGIVLRGAGTNATRLLYTYKIPEGKVHFYRLKPGDAFDILEIEAEPKDLQALAIEVDGKEYFRKTRGQHWGNTYNYRVGRTQVLAKVGPGRHTFTGKAIYQNGAESKSSMELAVSADPVPPMLLPTQSGAIAFAGSADSARFGLSKDGRRGDLSITLSNAASFRVGDHIEISAPPTPRWNELIKNACAWGAYRQNQYEIVAVEGETLKLAQPLRLEFPLIDGSYVRKIYPVHGGGVEDLYVEQTENLWINTVSFSRTWGAWARRVHVRMAGKNPVYFLESKFGEIRDCVFDDAWFKGGGGTAYAGVEVSYDCLLDGMVTFDFRHAPDFNWACSGNVVRNGRFYLSDAQWHSGWCNENLFENCIIQPDAKDGDYGFGFFSTAPEDDAHGPIGPRNVIYHCDFASAKDGGILNGMNEGWLVLYNRFVVQSGTGLSIRLSSFDHTIMGNVFAFPNGAPHAILIKDPNCIGIEVVSNRAYGAKAFTVGRAKPEKDQGNELLPFGEAPRPKPAVPSIYEWQKKNYPLP